MTTEFATTTCRSIIAMWASVFELEISNLYFPLENCVAFSVSTLERLPVFAIARLYSFLGSGIVVKTAISRGGLSMSVVINNYRDGHIADLWRSHEEYFGR